MANAIQQIRGTDRVKRKLDRFRREGESYNDVLERVLDEEPVVEVSDGFGRWSDADAERVRAGRRAATEKRRDRIRDRAGDAT